tara:strand:- start:314 stop:688 length:375 start_codon:yes stop_codon:yes gene_type:complete
MNQKFSIIKQLKSFSFALNGLKILFKEEHNARIQLVAAFLVILMGVYFNINSFEWVIVVLSIGFVFVSELLNSSIEAVCDFIQPEKHQAIKRIKDLAAGAVLFSAITALVVACIIFSPKIIALF